MNAMSAALATAAASKASKTGDTRFTQLASNIREGKMAAASATKASKKAKKAPEFEAYTVDFVYLNETTNFAKYGECDSNGKAIVDRKQFRTGGNWYIRHSDLGDAEAPQRIQVTIKAID